MHHLADAYADGLWACAISYQPVIRNDRSKIRNAPAPVRTFVRKILSWSYCTVISRNAAQGIVELAQLRMSFTLPAAARDGG